MTIQAQIVEVLKAAREETQAAIILITHDLGLIAELADRVVVMYAGNVVELADVYTIFNAPRHPYTLGLLNSLARVDADQEWLHPIPGQPPSLVSLPPGCRFHPRCEYSHGRRRLPHRLPGAAAVRRGRRPLSRCHFAEELSAAARDGVRRCRGSLVSELPEVGPTSAESVAAADAADELLRVEGLVKHFPIKAGVFKHTVGAVRAVDGVDLEIKRGETLGVVGESGCGKTTLGRTVMKLLEPTAGRIVFDGRDITALRPQADARRPARDPDRLPGSLRVAESEDDGARDRRRAVADPRPVPGHNGRQRVEELLRTVGLSPEHANRFPHEFSGGQRQRIGVARALALNPR